MEEYEAVLKRLIKFIPEAMKVDEDSKIHQLQGEGWAFELTTYAVVGNKVKLLEHNHH